MADPTKPSGAVACQDRRICALAVRKLPTSAQHEALRMMHIMWLDSKAFTGPYYRWAGSCALLQSETHVEPFHSVLSDDPKSLEARKGSILTARPVAQMPAISPPQRLSRRRESSQRLELVRAP